MRRESSGVGLAILFLVLVTLQFTLRPLLDWRATVDFLAIAVLLVAVRVRPGMAALIGCLAGLISDALVPAAFGSAVIACSAVAFAASWMKGAFFGEHVLLNAVFLLLGKFAIDVTYLLLEGRLGGGDLLRQLGVWSLMSAVVTAIVGLALLVLFRPLVVPEGSGL